MHNTIVSITEDSMDIIQPTIVQSLIAFVTDGVETVVSEIIKRKERLFQIHESPPA